MRVPEGVWLVDKPVGITSFDVIRILRRQLGIKKIGHAGTLDPAASGLMILGVGAATKTLTEFIKLDKEYEAEILLGRQTTTSDQEGRILKEVDTAHLKTEVIRLAFNKLTGELSLPVSPYSAIKQAGVPLYKKARAAERAGNMIVDVPMRKMAVLEGEFRGCSRLVEADLSMQLIKARLLVGSGTYIRSLAEELGRLLALPASLYSLRRTKVGQFSVTDDGVVRLDVTSVNK